METELKQIKEIVKNTTVKTAKEDCIKVYELKKIIIKNLKEDEEAYLFGPSRCPFCELYYHSECQDCPIYLKTNQRACENNIPFQKLCAIKSRDRYNNKEKMLNLFDEEIEFLKSL